MPHPPFLSAPHLTAAGLPSRRLTAPVRLAALAGLGLISVGS